MMLFKGGCWSSSRPSSTPPIETLLNRSPEPELELHVSGFSKSRATSTLLENRRDIGIFAEEDVVIKDTG